MWLYILIFLQKKNYFLEESLFEAKISCHTINIGKSSHIWQ